MRERDGWRTSSYTGQEGSCVALNGDLDAVRDTKNGAVLPLTRRSIAELLAAVRRAEA